MRKAWRVLFNRPLFFSVGIVDGYNNSQNVVKWGKVGYSFGQLLVSG